MPFNSQQISPLEYVVYFPSHEDIHEVRHRLEKLGTLYPVAGRAGTFIVRLSTPASSGRKGWEKVRDAVGTLGEVFPVFLDDRGAPTYPVGTVMVRFASPLSDAELEKWLPQGLRVKGRNEFVPAQVALVSDHPGQRYLPDVLSDLKNQNDYAVTVWPETLQAFRRG